MSAAAAGELVSPARLHYSAVPGEDRLAGGMPLTEVLKQLLCGGMRTHDLGPVTATKARGGGQWVVTDGNKRLLLCRLLLEHVDPALTVAVTTAAPGGGGGRRRLPAAAAALDAAVAASPLQRRLEAVLAAWRAGPFSPRAGATSLAEGSGGGDGAAPAPRQRLVPRKQRGEAADELFVLECAETAGRWCYKCTKCWVSLAILVYVFALGLASLVAVARG